MSRVYFIPTSTKYQSGIAAEKLLKTVIEKENIPLEHEIPLKVQFGELCPTTHIHQEQLIKLIEFLKLQNVKTEYIETNSLYRGKRMKASTHIQLAKENGFDALPIIIADGEKGEETTEYTINQKNIKSAKLASGYDHFKQIIVISHFKDHVLAGFSGALKQLSMGFASRSGKLDMHSHNHPFINPTKCKKCHSCEEQCPVDAIHIGFFPHINQKVCIGCAQCIINCPYGVIKTDVFSKGTHVFRERMIEYAYAAQKHKELIYISFVTNISETCEIETKLIKDKIEDIGVLASTDPVALDKACYDMLEEKGIKLKGEDIFEYAQKLEIGTPKYILIQVENKE